VRKADYHHSVPFSRNLGALTSWNPLGLFRPVMGTALPFLLCPILRIIASLLHLFCSSNIPVHISDQIFFSAPSFPKYANFAVKRHASEPHSTAGLIVVLYVLIFVVLDTAFDLNRGNTK
jgi:hypothetical protein